MPVANLISKIAAGGLSAGVFLLWWPQHVRGDGLEALIVRGLLWTLLAELLIVAFSPLENRATAAVRRWAAPGVARMRRRVAAVPGRARTGGAVVLAFAGFAAPASLLVGTSSTPVRPASARERIVERVIVQKPVVRERVVVKRVWAEAAAPLAHGTATRSPAAAAVAAKPAARKVVRKVAAAPRPAVRNAPAATTTMPASTTTTETTPPATPPAAAAGTGDTTATSEAS